MCKFSSIDKNSWKLDPNHNRKLIELKNQIFNYSNKNNEKKLNSQSWKFICSAVLSVLSLVASLLIAVLIFVKKKNNGENSELNDCELQSETNL